MSKQRTSAPATTSPYATSGRRAAYYLIAAALLAILAGGLAFAYLDSVRRASLPIVETLTASTRIPAGTLITQDMIVLRLYPANLLPGGSLSRVEQAVGRTSQVAIEEAEVILESKLRRGSTGGLAPLLPPEHHAMLLPAGWLAGAAPPLATGDRIDVLATHAQSAESGVLLSDIEVIGVSGNSQAPDNLYLAVTLDEGKSVLAARVQGHHLLVLVRPEAP
jgi:Flp pilus assembly protein CpaB